MARREKIWLFSAAAIAAVVLGAVSTLALAALSGAFNGPAIPPGGAPQPSWRTASCESPGLAGTVVDVELADMGGMMHGYQGYPGRGGMMGRWYPGGPGMMGGWYPGDDDNTRGWSPAMGRMALIVSPAQVHAGQVSIRAVNVGGLSHELVVLPLSAEQTVGQRPIGSDGKIDEAGSLGEASRSCGADNGGGIAAGSLGWTTLTLRPGRYELVCNFPGHYAAGMFGELDVRP